MNLHIYLIVLATVTGLLVGSPSTVYGKLIFDDELETSSVEESSVQDNANHTENAAEEKQVAESKTEKQSDTTRSESLRRHRMRQELRNEDLLTQKLEELRLKDELKRQERILGAAAKEEQSSKEDSQITEQRIESPSTVKESAVSNASSIEPTVVSTSVVDGTVSEKTSEKLQIKISPRGGMSGIINSIYDIQPKFSAGIAAEVGMSDYVAMELGYTFSQYDIRPGNTLYNPYALGVQRLQLNDNIFNLGAKLYVIDRKSSVRPYIGAGLSYRRGYVNYDNRTLDFLRTYVYTSGYETQDVEISAYSGYVDTGLEIKISDSISLTGMARYYNILSSSQNRSLDPYAFLSPQAYGGVGGYPTYAAYNTGVPGLPGGLGGYGYNSDAKGRASNALARQNFFQVMAGVTISF